MSTVAEKAAARRAKILARSQDRMATVTGGMAASAIPSASPETLTQAQADEAIERALAAVENSATTPAGSTAAPAADAVAPAAAVETVPDPHEFLSAADAREFSPPPSPSRSAASSLASPFAYPPFPSALSSARARPAAPASLPLDLPVVPTVSPLTAWTRRVRAQARKTEPVRAATVAGVVAMAVMAGLGRVEGGLAWLVMIEVMALSVGWIQSTLNNRSSKTASKPAATSRPAAPAPPPMSTSDDGDVIDLDTDLYRAQTQAPSAANPLSAFNMPGMQLPPGMDNMLTGLQMLMKYAAVMKQLLHDGMLFVFTCVCVNALWQLSLGEERVKYA